MPSLFDNGAHREVRGQSLLSLAPNPNEIPRSARSRSTLLCHNETVPARSPGCCELPKRKSLEQKAKIVYRMQFSLHTYQEIFPEVKPKGQPFDIEDFPL
jgi:hypothetical protein